MGDIRKMLDPKTVALIGASDKPDSIGRAILQTCSSVQAGRVFPVNLRKKTLFDIPAYPDVSSLPEKIDLAIIATPAATVPSVVEECGKAGVEGAIIVSSGFRETGAEGERREEELADVRKRYAMRIMGPNCLGLIRPHIGLNTTPLASNPLRATSPSSPRAAPLAGH